jgi:hypothetical protein
MNVHVTAEARLECSKCHAIAKVGCNCGVSYVYVKAGQRATEYVAAHPEKSDSAIAAEIGVSRPTVKRARKAVCTNVQTEKQPGKDGKLYPTTKSRANKVEALAEAIKAKTGHWPASKALAQEAGVHSRNADNALRAAKAAEEARIKALAEAQTEAKDAAFVASVKFTKAQQGHIDAAKRMMERKLKLEHAARIKQIDEEVRLRVIAENADYLTMVKQREEKAIGNEDFYREMINDHKTIFTSGEFMSILKCLHPDNSASAKSRADAFDLFNSRKLQLTKES